MSLQPMKQQELMCDSPRLTRIGPDSSRVSVTRDILTPNRHIVCVAANEENKITQYFFLSRYLARMTNGRFKRSQKFLRAIFYLCVFHVLASTCNLWIRCSNLLPLNSLEHVRLLFFIFQLASLCEINMLTIFLEYGKEKRRFMVYSNSIQQSYMTGLLK